MREKRECVQRRGQLVDMLLIIERIMMEMFVCCVAASYYRYCTVCVICVLDHHDVLFSRP
jgi:hypothetical protein